MLKQVKIHEDVKKELDSLKYYENDSYSGVIKRLIVENRSLKNDKQQLFKILLNNHVPENDSELDSIIEYVYFILTIIKSDKPDEEKLQVLTDYLDSLIVEDPNIVLNVIDYVEGFFSSGVPEALVMFSNFVKSSI